MKNSYHILENSSVLSPKENKPFAGSFSLPDIPCQYRKTPKYSPFQFLWRIRLILALFAKIRHIFTSPISHQSPLNRGYFSNRGLIGALFYRKSIPQISHFKSRFFYNRNLRCCSTPLINRLKKMPFIIKMA